MSNITASSNKNNVSLVLFIIGMAAAGFAVIGPMLAVPHFRSTFAAMGYDLPWFTQAALSFYPALALLPVVTLAAWLFWPTKSRRGIASFSIGVGGWFLFTVLLVAALQYPAFQSVQSLVAL